MFGYSSLAAAVERIDRLFEQIDDPKQTLVMVKAHRGHMAGAYLFLPRFLVDNKTGLRYAWVEPADASPRGYSVSMAGAVSLVDCLSGTSNIGAEPIVLTGSLEKVDNGKGDWRLVTENGEFSGKRKENSPSLERLKIEGALSAYLRGGN